MSGSKKTRNFNQHTPLLERFHASYVINAVSGCWLWVANYTTAPDLDKRPRIKVNGKIMTAYRLSYELFRGPIPPKALCCHTCDVSLCVNPGHLFLGSQKDNVHDMIAKGRANFQIDPEATKERGRKLGAKNNWSKGKLRYNLGKLTKEERNMIESDFSANLETDAALATKFNISRQAVRGLRKRGLARAALAKAQS